MLNYSDSLSTDSIVVPLILSLILFALSWIRPGRIVTLPSSEHRSRLLARVGIAGSLGVMSVTAAAIAFRLSQLNSLEPSSGYEGWWLRPAPLFAAGIIVAIAALAMHFEPLPPAGERTISPRRSWWAFTPHGLAWATAVAGALVFATAGWQTLSGVSAPAEFQDHMSDLPIYVPTSAGVWWAAGAGWPNHLATLLVMIATAVMLVLTLGRDANRPVFARSSSAEARAERTTTARLLIITTLGGVLLTFGAVWAHTGYIGSQVVSVYSSGPGVSASLPITVGSGYQDFVGFLQTGGYMLQALGTAILLRLCVDSWRALRFARSMHRPDSVDHGAVLASTGVKQ